MLSRVVKGLVQRLVVREILGEWCLEWPMADAECSVQKVMGR